MRRILSISVILVALSAAFWGHAGERSCFQPDGTPVDFETYREQARIHNAEVARIRTERRIAMVDAQARPLVDARGNEIRYTRMAAFEPKPHQRSLGYRAIPVKFSATGGGKDKFWKKAKSGQAFMVGKDSYKTAKDIDKAIYDQAFQRAIRTGDMSGLKEWKKGHFRRNQGLLTREDYETPGK